MNGWDMDEAKKGNKMVSEELGGVAVSNFCQHSNGITFTVESELDAYKAAYKYRYCKKTNVNFSEDIGAWVVQVYTAE